MNRIMLAVLLLLATPALAEKPGGDTCPDKTSPNIWTVIGVTSAVSDGDMGPFGFTTLCEAEFGPSRMCSPGDRDRTLTTVVIDQPVWLSGGSCSEYTDNSPGDNGTVMLPNGDFVQVPCSETHAVLCCGWR